MKSGRRGLGPRPLTWCMTTTTTSRSTSPPPRAVFCGVDVEAEDLPKALCVDADGHDRTDLLDPTTSRAFCVRASSYT